MLRMPLPRKNVVVSRTSDINSDSDLIVPGPKKRIFDRSEMGLGLRFGAELSSAGSGESGLSGEDRAGFELNLNKAVRREAGGETFEWVQNLVTARRAKHQHAHSSGSTPSTRAWLFEQHRALDDGSVPITFKCILAASGISRRFNECREAFQKPEYRSRYWDWSNNFLLLVDYFIDNGDINVKDDAPPNFDGLVQFIAHCKRQRLNGQISTQRDQLLTALGMKWGVVKESTNEADEEEEDLSNVSSFDSNFDEDWEMPSDQRSSHRTRKVSKSATARKRKRSAYARESSKARVAGTAAAKESLARSSSPPPLLVRSVLSKPTGYSLQLWAKKFLEVRRFFKRRRGEATYEIPLENPSLRIWMNAEVARTSTGALGDLCCGILEAAEMVDPSESMGLGDSVELWAQGFVDYVDHNVRPGKLGRRYIHFMLECRSQALQGILPCDRAALMSGIDGGWLNSADMQSCVLERQRRKMDRGASLRRKLKAESGEAFARGKVVNAVVDSETSVEEKNPRRKRCMTASIVTEMLSTMIGGEVAVTVKGRSPTLAEQRARKWILEADAKTFDQYGRQWFRAAFE